MNIAFVAFMVPLGLSAAISAAEELVVLLVQNIWGLAYSNNEEVTKCHKGCGQQKIGAFISIASYYIVGIPSAFFFAFLCCSYFGFQALKANGRVFSSTLPVDMLT
uniref:Uncharacterized protein n=1 Tax=Setaria italica TaxID=4555 RepID=K3YZ57_SETIT